MRINVSDHFLLGAMPSFLTLILLVFLISLTIRAGKTRRENQLFILICIIHLAHHLAMVLGDFLSPSVQSLYLFRAIHLGFVFLLPLSVHYVHTAVGLPHTKRMVIGLYGVSFFMLPFVLSDHYFSPGSGAFPSGGPVFAVFLVISMAFLLAYAVIAAVWWNRSRDESIRSKCLYILVGLFPAYLLTYGDALPMFGIDSYSVGGFVFIPMGLYTYGVLRHRILDNRSWFSMGYIPDFLTFLVWLPLVLGLMFFVLTRKALFYPDVLHRLFPQALPAMVSVLVCYSLASFCFQQGSRRVATLVFGGVCTLWGLLNLDIIFLFILKDSQTALTLNRFEHFFLVMQVGLCSHLFYFFAGFRRWMVYLAYGVSLVFVPLTQTPWYLSGMAEYPWGFFAQRAVLFDVLIGIALVKLCLGFYVIVRKIKAAEPKSRERRQTLIFFVGVFSMGAFGLTNLPAMSGVDFYPLGTFMFIPVLLMAYGVFRYDVVSVNLYSRRRLWDGTAVILTWVGYLLLALVVYLTLRDLPPARVISRVVGSGIPLVLSLTTCVFFSVLSLRVGPSLTGSRLFGLICLIFGFLSTDILLNSLVTRPETGLRISRLNHIFLVMWPALYVHLVALVCRHKQAMPWVRFYYGAGLCFALLSQSPWYLTGVASYSWGFFAQRGPLFDLFCLFTVLNYLYCLWMFWEARKRQTNRLDRQRLDLFSLGLGALSLFTAGNIPAMSGYDLYPLGNFVCIPIALFGYAMFRKNIKDVLALLNRFIYALGLLGFLLLAAGLVMILRPLAWTGSTVFLFLVAGLGLFMAYKRIWSDVLALFFGRQQEMLDRELIRLTDRLSRSRSLDDIVGDVSEPLFGEVAARRLRLLFYSETEERFLVFDGLHPRIDRFSRAKTSWDYRLFFPADHPLFPLIRKERGTLGQARVEAWITDRGMNLPADDWLRSADIIQPVFSDSGLISLILLYGKEDGSVYSKIEKAFIGRLGLMLGPYIENARLLQGLELEIEKRTGDLSEALSEITVINRFMKQANASLNLDDILSALLEIPEPGFRFETVMIQLVDADRGTLVLSEARGNTLSEEQQKNLVALSSPLSGEASLAAQCIGTGQGVYRNQFSPGDPGCGLENAIYGIIPFASMLILPMDIRNEVIGNIVVLSGRAPFNFNDRDIDKIQGYVTRISSAVNNARLYDRAEAAARVKSDFLARMSHEIRSPLTAILGMGELLTETPLSDEQARYIDIMNTSGTLLLSVINDILDFSKLEAGRVTLEAIPFDLYRLMNDLRHIITASAERKNLSFDLDFHPAVNRHVTGDPFKLAQVVMNLADNAVRFTEQGSVKLRVDHPGDPDGLIRFSVIDTGVGIPEDKTALIFESFSQAESSTTRRYGGTGLGLTICRKLVDLMGGSLSVYSHEGRGSRFFFTANLPPIDAAEPLPLTPVNASMIRPMTREPDLRDGGLAEIPLRQASFTFLLAEDMATNIHLVRLYLKDLPVKLDVAQDGAEAVRLFKERPYDLVLMDIHMPHMDGFEAIRQIRDFEKESRRAQVSVVALSAHVAEKGRDGVYGAFDAFLVKPFTKKDLLETLRGLLFIPEPEKTPETNGPVTMDPDLLPIIEALIEEIHEELPGIQKSIENADYDTASRLSHGLKGAAGNCGLTALCERFSSLHDCILEKNDRISMDIVKDIKCLLGRFSKNKVFHYS